MPKFDIHVQETMIVTICAIPHPNRELILLAGDGYHINEEGKFQVHFRPATPEETVLETQYRANKRKAQR